VNYFRSTCSNLHFWNFFQTGMLHLNIVHNIYPICHTPCMCMILFSKLDKCPSSLFTKIWCIHFNKFWLPCICYENLQKSIQPLLPLWLIWGYLVSIYFILNIIMYKFPLSMRMIQESEFYLTLHVYKGATL